MSVRLTGERVGQFTAHPIRDARQQQEPAHLGADGRPAPRWARYSATVRSVPANSPSPAFGPRAGSGTSRQAPGRRPSPRSDREACRSRLERAARPRPASSSAASSTVKLSSAARISTSRCRIRGRCSGAAASSRVVTTSRSCGTGWRSRNASDLSTCGLSISCRSSSTSTIGPGRPAIPQAIRRTNASSTRGSGTIDARGLSSGTAPVLRSAPIRYDQNAAGLLS